VFDDHVLYRRQQRKVGIQRIQKTVAVIDVYDNIGTIVPYVSVKSERNGRPVDHGPETNALDHSLYYYTHVKGKASYLYDFM
jgi:hypothetical protein